MTTYVCMHLLLQHNSHRRVCVVNVAIVVITSSASPCHLSCTDNCGIDDVIDTSVAEEAEKSWGGSSLSQ